MKKSRGQFSILAKLETYTDTPSTYIYKYIYVQEILFLKLFPLGKSKTFLTRKLKKRKKDNTKQIEK